MKHLGLVLFIYSCCVLQTSYRHTLAVGEMEPHFLKLALMIVVLTVNGGAAVVWAAIVGLLSDALTPGRLGIEMFCSVLAVFTVLRWIPVRNPATLLRATGVGSVTVFTALLTSAVVRRLLAGEYEDVVHGAGNSLGTAACTAALGLLVIIALRLLKQLWPIDDTSRKPLAV